MDKSTENLSSLSRELLRTHLDGLDSFLTSARQIQLPSLPSLPPEEVSVEVADPQDTVASTTAELQKAQLQEVRSLLADLQEAAVTERQQFRQRPLELGLGEDELLLFLGRERTKEARRTGDLHGGSTSASAQRSEATASALLAARHAAVQRRLALEQLRSEQLHSAEEFGQLRDHLEALKRDAVKAAQLAPHTATDLALSFAGALVRRKELLKKLGEATWARQELLRAAHRREQLLSSALAEPLRAELTDSGQVTATAAPAAVLAIAETLDAFGYSSSQSLAGRVRNLADRNVELWKELSAAWSGSEGEASSVAADPAPSPAETKPAAGQLSFRKPPALIPGPAAPPPIPQPSRRDIPSLAAKGVAIPSIAIAEAVPEESDVRPTGGRGHGLFDLDLEGPFQGWQKAARQSRLWKRRKREENARRYLGKWGRAQAVWALLGALHGLVSAYRPVADAGSLVRGQRVRAHGQSGAFLSCTDRGVCKVLFDGAGDAQIVAAQDLDELQPGHHPFMVGVIFAAWSLLSATGLQLATSRLRSDLGFHRAFGKIGRSLLIMAMLTDTRIAMKFLLTRWHNFVAAKEMEKSRLRRLREVFKAWFDVLVMVKHNNALDRLDETKLELENARAKCLKASRRCEWLKVQVDRACAMELDFWGSWVLWAWLDVARISRDERDSTLQGRLARAAATLKLSESMGKAGVDFLKPLVSAWAALVLRQRKARAAAAQRVYGVGSDTLRKAFQAWQEIKNAEFENIKRQLRRKEEDFQELQSLSSRLYTFSKHASSRVEHLESALRAAERALFAGQDRGEALEREVLGLQSQLLQEAMISESRLRQQEVVLHSRFEAELGQATALDRSLVAELGASEESQVRLRQELGAERAEAAETDERLQAEIEIALSEAEDFEATAQRHREERRVAEEEEKAHRAEAAAHRERLQDMEASAAGQSLAASRQLMPPPAQLPPTRTEATALPQPSASSTLHRPEVEWKEPQPQPSATRTQPQQPPQPQQEEQLPPAEAIVQHGQDSKPAGDEAASAGAGEAQAEDGYTKEEWMDFFVEEGLGSDQLAVLDQIFQKLDTSGDGVLSADELSAALNDRSLKMSEETRQALVDFMYDVA